MTKFVLRANTVYIRVLRIARLGAFLFAMAWLLVPSHVQAQNCLTTVNNKAGDSITITGLLTTTDPNENGEGEPVVFSSSGGDLSGASISDYFQSHTFTYTSQQDNETISGINQGADFDEGCNVSAIISAQSLKFGILTQQDRTALESASKNLAIDSSAVGLVALLCADTIIAGPFCSLPFGSTAGVGLLTAAILDKIATDPSDPNFMVIAQPVLLTVQPVTANGTLTQAEADAFNALLLNEENIIAYGQALITSYNRAQGAFDAQNAAWQAQQLQAAAQYQGALLGYVSAESGLRTTLANLLSADPNFSSFTLNPYDALNAEGLIAYSGLPASITQALVSLGADAPTVSTIQGLLFVQDINAVSGNTVSKIADSQLLSSLNTVVNDLGVTVPISIKPGSGTPAPINLGSKGLIPVAILSTSTFNAVSQVTPSSLTFGSNGTQKSLVSCDASGEDVNGDGLLDLVCQFSTQLTGLTNTSNTAVLEGKTNSGVPIRGQEAITILPAH